MPKLLIVNCAIIICVFSTNNYAEETARNRTDDFHTSFREPVVYSFENSSNEETIENLGTPETFDSWEWRENEGDTIFYGFVSHTKWWSKAERGFHPKEYSVSPLFWSLIIKDTDDDYKKDAAGIGTNDGGAPYIAESFVCLVKNRSTGTSYFLCLQRPIRSLWSWGPVGYTKHPEKMYNQSICQMNSNQDFQEQLTDFLKHICFGPNFWTDDVRCVALSVYCQKTEREKFQYPKINEETRRAFNNMVPFLYREEAPLRSPE